MRSNCKPFLRRPTFGSRWEPPSSSENRYLPSPLGSAASATRANSGEKKNAAHHHEPNPRFFLSAIAATKKQDANQRKPARIKTAKTSPESILVSLPRNRLPRADYAAH